MNTFWDTSAIVALLLQEPHTSAAQAAWAKSSRPWAWRWAVIETEAALSRRSAPPEAWTQWAALLESLHLLDLEPDRWIRCAPSAALCACAQQMPHISLFERASTAIPGLRLITFDQEWHRRRAPHGPRSSLSRRPSPPGVKRQGQHGQDNRGHDQVSDTLRPEPLGQGPQVLLIL